VKTLDEARAIRERQGGVDDETWSTVSPIATQIREVQIYALLQLDDIAKEFDGKRVAKAADLIQRRAPEVREWLAVLAFCFEQMRTFSSLKLDRVQADPARFDSHRLTMLDEQTKDLNEVVDATERLTGGLGVAVMRADSGRVWHLTDSETVLGKCRKVETSVAELSRALGIEAAQRDWELRELGPAAKLGSKAIQKSKDDGPKVIAVVSSIPIAKKVVPAARKRSSPVQRCTSLRHRRTAR
jgi:hypothetical protein